MAWEHLDITKPHLVYIILGGFTTLFMLCSSFIKERMYIGEATVATLCGVIFGPHAANLIDPGSWGNADIVTVEFSRIVLVVQCFAVGVELPKFYMEKHWKSVIFLLVPVMTFGWLITSLFIWWMIPPLDWLESLVVAACVTATDPVLASSVVGKGKFAKRVPKHLRDLLSAESGCNDGMAFPFIYLSLYLIQYNRSASEVSFHFVVYVILYECIFGAVYGFLIGYIARHGIRYAESRDLIDRESFLVFYFVVALFCAGSGSILGMDDLLVGFAAGVGFSNDGWFGEKTEESHVSNVIDLLLNLAYFVYFGTIIPWEQFNNGVFGMVAWRLVVIAIFVLLFRRIPIMMALKPLIPDVKNWREALFAGHFGPIGVGAIFVAILARAELEHHEPVPLGELPPQDAPHYKLIYLVWPIVTFLVISSILIHGSSIAVFTLGKRINTLTLTMSYTQAPEDGPSWMNRLPRISSQSRSMAKTNMSETSFDDLKEPSFPAGTLAPPSNFLRRQKDEDGHSRPGSRASSLVSRKRKHKKWDDGIGPGGPVSQSAIFPNRPSQVEVLSEKESSPPTREATDSTTLGDEEPKEKHVGTDDDDDGTKLPSQQDSSPHVHVYDEGHQLVFENDDGDVIDIQPAPEVGEKKPPKNHAEDKADVSLPSSSWKLAGLRRKMSEYYSSELEKRKDKGKNDRRHEPARAYQFGNTIIVEDEDGEVVKTYDLPSSKPEGQESDLIGASLKYLGLGARRHAEKNTAAAAEEGQAGPQTSAKQPFKTSWAGFGQRGEQSRRKSVAQQQTQVDDDDDDKKIRFTIGGVGRRMTKEDFIREVQMLDSGTRNEVVDTSTASSALKSIAKEDPPPVNHKSMQESSQPSQQQRQRRQEQQRAPVPVIRQQNSESSSNGESSRAGGNRSVSVSPTRKQDELAETPRGRREHVSDHQPETAVERRRRLAVLASQNDQPSQTDDTGETPAERRRRQAALGMGGPAAEENSDSEDEGTERVPPTRKGIRFAEPQKKGN
ncbi:Na+/H+ antiporter [Conoideocrella luteorostrata]|uniref:Na+/H+ antiporter n=1 Tax=Conoideocrella luteorostrata TaxID=1105319 RepID=A0AAJ0FSG4_9HYPO|nr:Na+/H+ antiporter [Conoideocrella luteorostrata]